MARDVMVEELLKSRDTVPLGLRRSTWLEEAMYRVPSDATLRSVAEIWVDEPGKGSGTLTVLMVPSGETLRIWGVREWEVRCGREMQRNSSMGDQGSAWQQLHRPNRSMHGFCPHNQRKRLPMPMRSDAVRHFTLPTFLLSISLMYTLSGKGAEGRGNSLVHKIWQE